METGRGTISLVFEADVRELARNGSEGRALEIVGQPDVYVIDGDGVRLLRRGNALLRAAMTGIITFLLLWAISRLLRRSR